MPGPLVFDPYSRDYKTISRFCRDGVVPITKLCWRMRMAWVPSLSSLGEI